MPIPIGEKARAFALKDQHGNVVALEGLRGRKVVLSFHPLAFTRICTYQMQDLERSKEQLDALNAVALGISVDPVPAKHAWAKEIGVKHTPLLSDFWPHGEVAEMYGVFRRDDGFSERAVYILDGEHTVRWVKIYPISERPSIEEILKVLESL